MAVERKKIRISIIRDGGRICIETLRMQNAKGDGFVVLTHRSDTLFDVLPQCWYLAIWRMHVNCLFYNCTGDRQTDKQTDIVVAWRPLSPCGARLNTFQLESAFALRTAQASSSYTCFKSDSFRRRRCQLSDFAHCDRCYRSVVSVCLTVYLSRSYTVLKQQKISTRFLLHTTSPCLFYIMLKFDLHRSTTSPQSLPQSDAPLLIWA